jgi:ubiquinone/menaquinone biosynthesis C-methylase UbiE
LTKPRNFWSQIAQTDSGGVANQKDQVQATLENESVLKLLKGLDFQCLLEVGCANGGFLRQLRKLYPTVELHGLDFTPEFIERAKFIGGEITYKVGNVLHLPYEDCSFDAVLSKRCLINLENGEEQQEAIFEIRRVLKPKGTLTLLESTEQGYTALNKARRKVGLPEIKVACHNHPLGDFSILGFRGREHECLGAYYYLTRIYYPLMIAPKESEYNTRFHEEAAQVQRRLGDIQMPNVSPLILWSLQKT